MTGEFDSFGKYKIMRPLGKGGMGEVYEAVHATLGTPCAIKVFSLDHGEVDFLRNRFLAEGKALARLRHPNLVRVYDMGIDDGNKSAWFAMDLVVGKDGKSRTLADLAVGEADERQIAAWFRQLASALDYIHGEGIVHRDIKPGNILIDAGGKAILGDFGVSRFLDGKLRDEIEVETTSNLKGDAATSPVFGTAGYVAPEIKAGGKATPASDVYALGVVLFRLLTGFRYEPDTNVGPLLEQFELPWKDVLPEMLAANPDDRPPKLATLAARLMDGGRETRDEGRAALLRGRKLLSTLALLIVLAISVPLCLCVENNTIKNSLSFAVSPTSTVVMTRCPAGEFIMGGSRFDNKYWKADEQFLAHKVRFTRPFWIAKERLVAESLSADDFDRLCQSLTKKHQNEIPDGFVFRAPSEAEWEYAYNANSADPSDPYTWSDAKCFDLAKKGDVSWRDATNAWGIVGMNDGKLELTCDVIDPSREKEANWILTNPSNATFKYASEETDPVRSFDGEGARRVTRGRQGQYGSVKGTVKPSNPATSNVVFRLCLGPSLTHQPPTTNH